MRGFLSLAVILSLFALPAARAATTGHTPTAKPAPKVSLGAFVRTLLPNAAQNFAGMRGAKYDSDTYYVEYKALPKAGLCKACKIYDQYARGRYLENWYLENRWNSTWSTAANETYIRSQLAPVLSGFALHRTVSYSYPTFMWRNLAGVWVYIDTYKTGFTLRIGRDLVTAVHTLSPPSKLQLQTLANGATNLIRLALPDAGNNFASLRAPGKKKDILGNTYQLNTSFGSMFRSCDLSDVSYGFGYKDFQPKWLINCRTVSMAGTKAALEETVRAAVYNAIPSGFTAVTDASALLFDDYRWDNSDTMASVSIGSFEDKGIVNFTISILHFLPKPTK